MMWMGPHVEDGRLSVATLVGFATHVATSGLMGVIALPSIDELPTRRTLLSAHPALGTTSFAERLTDTLQSLIPGGVRRAARVGLAGLGAGALGWLAVRWARERLC